MEQDTLLKNTQGHGSNVKKMKKKFLSMNWNYVFTVALAGNLLALTGDTTLTWSSPVLPKLYSNDSAVNPLGAPITKSEESWIGSLQYIGAMVGILPFAFLADVIGRKPVLLLLSIPHIAAFVCFAFAKTIGWYYLESMLPLWTIIQCCFQTIEHLETTSEIDTYPYRNFRLIRKG